MKILVTDDSATIRRLLAARLTADGHEVAEAVDGQEAVDLALADHPDLIVLDRQMPKMDGLEATERIRQNPETAQIVILMLTAVSSEDALLEGLERGVDEYMLKPFSPRELSARVRMLGARRAGGAAAVAAQAA